jgi:hypothetical protein
MHHHGVVDGRHADGWLTRITMVLRAGFWQETRRQGGKEGNCGAKKRKIQKYSILGLFFNFAPIRGKMVGPPLQRA